MPKRQPFTALCTTLSQPATTGRADLHVHTCASDGVYSPTQVMELARRAKLAAVSITDHDTLAGVVAERERAVHDAANGTIDPELIAGVEISCEYENKEIHLLGYFVDVTHVGLVRALASLQQARVTRFHAMAEQLRSAGVPVAENALPVGVTLGRRHIADLLVQSGAVHSVREAFVRYLHDKSPYVVAKERMPLKQALEQVRAAGGVASWAHPSYDCTVDAVSRFKDWGLGALEVEFPSASSSRQKALRQVARTLDLTVTGGSDCHGPDNKGRYPGSHGIDQTELEQLRMMAGR